MIFAAGVVAVGGVLYLIRYGGAAPNYQVFHGEPTNLRGLAGILTDVVTLHRRALIQLGLLLLIATPIARVVFSVFAFAKQRDYTYVIVTLIVLGVLMYSLFGTH